MSNPAIPSLLVTLLDRLQSQEALELEFKAARGGLPRDLWETVSAFANTSGGWIVLGVGQANEELDIHGVTNASNLLKVLHDLLRNPQKISYPICSANDVSVESLEEKQVVVLRVPAAPRKARPVYINGNPYAGTYVRRHSSDFRCTKPEVDRMMREASDVAADSTILRGFGWDDIDRETLARYRRWFQTLHPDSPWNGYDDQSFLRALGGFRRDRETGEEGITVAGLLTVGTSEALREWRGRHLIDYRLVSDETDSGSRWEDRVSWQGNLVGAFETIYPRLIDGLPKPFRLQGSTRIDESPVHVALREALVNLLVHADYAETQVSLIKRSPEGYFFRNPGSSRVSEADLLTGDRSDPRNPVLVHMFRMVGLAEEAGTGIPKIIKAWRERGFQLPAIDVGTERYEFTLWLRHAHLLSEEDRAWLSSLSDHWTEAEQLALVLARHHGSVDNLKLRSLTGQHPADVTKILGGLRDRGLLQMIGGGRGARYELGPMAAGTGTLAGPVGMRLRSEGKESNSKGNGQESEGKEFSSEGIWLELREISKVARERQRLDSVTRDKTIVELCARAPLSLHELAELLNRSEAYIRETLRSLIASGLIGFLYPDQPNHPRQKYVAHHLSSSDAGNP